MNETEHQVALVAGWSTEQTTPLCSCGWIGADWRDAEKAAEEAQQHFEGKRQSWHLDPDAPVRHWEPGMDAYDRSVDTRSSWMPR